MMSIVGRTICFAIAVWAAVPAQGDDRDVRFLDGLRERQLYRLAEKYVDRELAQSDLDPRRRVTLLVQQATTRTAIAVNSPPQQRSPAWDQARSPLDEYLNEHPLGSLRLLVAVQRALVDRTNGEVLRHELRPNDEAAAEACRGALRAAARQLGDVAADTKLIARQRTQGTAGNEEFGLGDDELLGIERGTVLELARTQRQLGLTYPAGSPDRDDGLLQALEQLQPLAAAAVADSLAWQARLEMLRALADLDRSGEGLSLVEQWTVDDTRTDGEWLAAVARLHNTSGQVDKAVATMASLPLGESPDCDLVRLEIGLANGAEGVAIQELLTAIRASHPPVWARRAALMAGEQLANSVSTDGAALELSAEHYLHARQLQLARDTYDKATRAHVAAQDSQSAVRTAERAAAVAVVMQDWASVAERYRQLAFAAPTAANAAAWHRERLLAMVSLARESPGDKQALAGFSAACREHLQHWPTGSIAHEVRVWLARQQLAAGDAQTAISTISTVDLTSDAAAEAIEVAASAYRRLAADPEADHRALTLTATEFFEPVLFGADKSWPAAWSAPQRAAALALADLRLRLEPPDSEYVQRLLTKALDGAPPPSGAWQGEAVPLLAIAHAAAGDAESAIARLSSLDADGFDPQSAARLLAELESRLRSEPPGSAFRAPLVEVIDGVLARLPETTELDTRRYRALTLAERGDRAQALALYRALIEDNARDGDLRESLSRLLAAGDGDDKRAALVEWQRIENASRRGGERWYRARLARVRLLSALNRADEARKLIALTRVLQPELGERLAQESQQ